MEPFHANYPFLDAAREAVREADLDLPAILAADRASGDRHPAVERGVQRVERALLDGTVVVPEDERHPGVQVELLSYPVARMLVSLLDAPGAIEKYASAEARTAHERFCADFERLPADRSEPRDGKVPLEYFLREFDLAEHVGREESGFSVDVAAYLRLSSGLEGEEWRLATRALADGAVPVTPEELHDLLREAVRERVAEGLPTGVPEEVRAGLADEVAELESAFSEIEVSRNVGTLDPGCFPPCVAALVDRASGDEPLADHAEFALVSFLASADADPEETVAFLDADGEAAERLRYRAARVGEEAGAQYAPPSCATMAAYGECPVADETDPTEDPRCETVSHPLSYYETALADGEGGR